MTTISFSSCDFILSLSEIPTLKPMSDLPTLDFYWTQHRNIYANMFSSTNCSLVSWQTSNFYCQNPISPSIIVTPYIRSTPLKHKFSRYPFRISIPVFRFLNGQLQCASEDGNGSIFGSFKALFFPTPLPSLTRWGGVGRLFIKVKLRKSLKLDLY